MHTEKQCEHAQILVLHVFLLACRSIKTFNQRLKALMMSLALMEGVLSLLVMFLVKLECDFCCPPYHPSLLLYPAAAQVQFGGPSLSGGLELSRPTCPSYPPPGLPALVHLRMGCTFHSWLVVLPILGAFTHRLGQTLAGV